MLQNIIIINNPNEINIKRIKQLKAELLLRDFKQIKFKDEVTAKLRKNNIMGLPVINLKFLLNQYKDPLSGIRTEVDNVKIRVLENVLTNNPNIDPVVVEEPIKTDMIPKKLF